MFCQFTILVPGLLGATLLMGFGILSINWCMLGQRSGSADQAGQAEEWTNIYLLRRKNASDHFLFGTGNPKVLVLKLWSINLGGTTCEFSVTTTFASQHTGQSSETQINEVNMGHWWSCPLCSQPMLCGKVRLGYKRNLSDFVGFNHQERYTHYFSFSNQWWLFCNFWGKITMSFAKNTALLSRVLAAPCNIIKRFPDAYLSHDLPTISLLMGCFVFLCLIGIGSVTGCWFQICLIVHFWNDDF